VQRELGAAGIGTGILYPVPLQLGPTAAAASFGGGDFPIAERAATEILSLPMFPGLSAAQQRRVVDHLARAVAGLDRIRHAMPARGTGAA
jgi:dTDP-4-amino-4,6-dideoxygalactose transaminase